MVNVACIMMQKNEELLLELWIVYHGYLFGFENIYIFDNGSTSAEVVRILKEYEAAGVKVMRNHNTPKDFDNKGWIIGDLINELQVTNTFDFFLPLDCDEFVILAGSCGFTTKRSEILGYFNKHKSTKEILRVSHSLVNVPGSMTTFALVDHYKSIIPSVEVRLLDHGFHEAELVTGKTFVSSDIVHLHMHNKPFPILLEHAKDKLRPFVNIDDKDALRAFNGVGMHLKAYLFDYESEYYVRYASMTRLRFLELELFTKTFRFANFKKQWGKNAPNWLIETAPNFTPDPSFTVAGYNDANPDVARAGMNPFLHYCIFGQREGRLIAKQPHLTRRELEAAAVAAITQRDWTTASQKVLQLKEAYPDDAEAHALEILVLREAGHFIEAEVSGASAMIRFPWYNRIRKEWALITFAERRWHDAQHRFRVFRDQFPDDPEGYVRGSVAAYESGDEKEAIRLLNDLVAQWPDQPTFAQLEASLAEQFGQWGRAAALWQSHAKNFPYEDAGWAGYIRCLHRLEKYEEAEEVAQAKLQQHVVLKTSSVEEVHVLTA